MAPGLLGPPELHSTTTTTNNAALSPPSTTTTNPAFLTTGNPCLDFFHVCPTTPSTQLIQRLQGAWQNAPMTTLKLICNLRGVRGTGKNDKQGFYKSALWVHQNHPKTLALNAGTIARFGSLKDLLEILFRVLEGPDVRDRMKEEWEKKKPEFFKNRGSTKRKGISEVNDDKVKAKSLRAEKKAAKAKKAVERYNHDPEYMFLYDCVSDVFAELLRRDVKLLEEEDFEKLSLAAKWCPSLDSSYDESLLICESIAKRVFPREEYVEYQDIEEAHYAYRVRTRLRKEVLVPLRKALKIPEVYMCAKRWRYISYERVPSLAMNLVKKVFLKRDRNRFEEYLEEVGDGDTTIAAGALLPSELIAGATDSNPKLAEVAELQWKRMVEDMFKQGSLANSIAVRNNVITDISTALILLVSELSSEPWKGKVITSGDWPEFHKIEGEKLAEKSKFMRELECHQVIDLQRVFDKILEFAVEENLGEDHMVRRVFVFSQEESEQVLVRPWETEYAEIQRKFMEKGFEKVPEVVFWFTKSSMIMPVRCDQQGLAIVSGFSKNLLTLLMKKDWLLTPEYVMYAAISGPEYDELVVHD